MNLTKAITTVCVPVTHFRSLDDIALVEVSFTVYQDEREFKAVPALTAEQRSLTGLPAELLFVYSNYCIARANDMGEETLHVIKQILLELQSQDLI